MKEISLNVKLKNRGITLIALIITIIVLLILARYYYINVSTEIIGILSRTVFAKFANEVTSIKEQVDMLRMPNENGYTGSINELLGINSAYNDKLTVQEGKLKYLKTVSAQEAEWFERFGIEKASDYYTVEFDLGKGEQSITKTIKKGEISEVPEVSDSFFRGWYYLKESGSEDNPTYTESVFDAENIPITRDYYIYAKYYNDAVMRTKNTSVSFWKSKYRPYVTDIIFTADNSLIPNTYEEVTNIKADSNAADVMAYIVNTSEGDATSYKVIIYSPNTIYANQNCKEYFNAFSNLKNIDLSNFSTSKTRIMHCMFYDCKKLETLDMSKIDTSNVTTMYRMFFHCENLLELDFSNHNSEKLLTLRGTFYGCYKLRNINFEGFYTNKVTNMHSVFYNCEALESLDINHFNTSKVTNMDAMFYGCLKLTELNISNFDTRKVTSMGSMFRKCRSLNVIYVGENWTTENKYIGDMFTNCKIKSVTKI